jgi:DNA-binding response OmpR family regulator
MSHTTVTSVPIHERTPYDSCILVVDDEPANTLLLEQLLRRWGYAHVTSITDSRKVDEAVAQLKPDLLLLDLNMPHRSGYDVMRELGTRDQGTTPLPILVLTADTTSETTREALRLGARDFLTKPFDHEEVRLRVGNLLTPTSTPSASVTPRACSRPGSDCRSSTFDASSTPHRSTTSARSRSRTRSCSSRAA